ncbi:type II secretion system F family protein [Acidithiobacillus sp.]|uniref:type II secretion system F family protein n=1 Tax=Acidithiobacillus sp. TaxID=1872118 RepID=UPI00258C323C|nr:type II secretion system F family protein [Acidithiobacillus sp.]MDD5375999.1 type II secretion system F family protein [Acidithiobacillus sp.]
MARFRYRARDDHGQLREGIMDAGEGAMVAQTLRSNQLIPITVEELREGVRIEQLWSRLNRRPISRADLALFSRQLYALLHAGIPVLNAIEGLISSHGPQTRLGEILLQVRHTLGDGQPLSVALAAYPKVFQPLYLRLVEVGETTGNLDKVLLQLSGYLEREDITLARVRQAFRYPLFVAIALSVAMVILNIMVIPAFAKLFANAHITLPIFTRMLIAFSNFTVAWWWLILLVAVAATYGFRFFLSQPHGRWLWDRFLLRTPIFGPLILEDAMARFGRTLQLVSGAGVPILKGMELVVGAVHNRFIESRLDALPRAILRGESLHSSATATGLFPPLVLQMLKVGEETGGLDEMMGEVADYYEREVEKKVDSLAARIEPIMVVIMGGLVFILAAGIYLPMWDMVKMVKQ